MGLTILAGSPETRPAVEIPAAADALLVEAALGDHAQRLRLRARSRANQGPRYASYRRRLRESAQRADDLANDVAKQRRGLVA